jgi:hypothetical protein
MPSVLAISWSKGDAWVPRAPAAWRDPRLLAPATAGVHLGPEKIRALPGEGENNLP